MSIQAITITRKVGPDGFIRLDKRTLISMPGARPGQTVRITLARAAREEARHDA